MKASDFKLRLLKTYGIFDRRYFIVVIKFSSELKRATDASFLFGLGFTEKCKKRKFVLITLIFLSCVKDLWSFGHGFKYLLGQRIFSHVISVSVNMLQ